MKQLFIFFFVVSNLSCKSQNDYSIFSVAKTTVQKIFYYNANGKYDSLKTIMSTNLVKHANEDDLKIYFRDIKRISDNEDIPDTSQFVIDTSRFYAKNELVIKFIPKSTNSINIDSVKFSFIKTIGFREVWVMEVFNNAKIFDKIPQLH